LESRFIAFEGPEGAGKTTQVGRLATRLRGLGHTVLETREPGGTRLGNAVRSILLGLDDYAILPETEVLLLAAARSQHVREVIAPALGRGEWVLCDRYVDSTYAYQGGGSGLPLERLQPIQDFATDGLAPDLRLLLDLPVEIGLQRRLGDGASVNRIDRQSVEFHQRVRAMYLDLAASAADRWLVIDARGNPDDVESLIWNETSRTLART
jgi:dTMP kinase